MKILIFIMLCILPVLAQTPASPAVKAGVTKNLQDGQEAWNQGDLDRFMAGYVKSPELTFTAGGRVVRGYDALQQRYQTTYGNSKASMGQLRFENIEVWELGPDYALALGEWILLLPQSGGPGGGALAPPGNKGGGVGDQVRGIFSLVLQRTGQGWLVLHDHTSRLEKEKPKSGQ